jgi:hypothetical protein
MLNPRFLTLTGMILVAALSRILPHPANATPITAMALFGGTYFSNRGTAFAIPLIAMFLSDLVIGFHTQLILVYLCFMITVCIGFSLRSRKKLFPIGLATAASSIIFFLVTNFGVWLFDQLYPKTMNGLWTCYAAAVPFFRNTFFGDLFYVGILVGSFSLAEKIVPPLREASPLASKEMNSY